MEIGHQRIDHMKRSTGKNKDIGVATERLEHAIARGTLQRTHTGGAHGDHPTAPRPASGQDLYPVDVDPEGGTVIVSATDPGQRGPALKADSHGHFVTLDNGLRLHFLDEGSGPVVLWLHGSVPPFGASVKNDKQQDTGIVNDEGSVYLSGIQPGSQMTVSWGSTERCSLSLPEVLPADGLASTLNLLCQPIKADSTPASAVLPDVLEKKAS